MESVENKIKSFISVACVFFRCEYLCGYQVIQNLWIKILTSFSMSVTQSYPQCFSQPRENA